MGTAEKSIRRNDLSVQPEEIVEALKKLYPKAECALTYQGDPWRLLVMARLSAQCTDARVNQVCETLFQVFPDCEAMASADLPTLERLIFSCGVYKVKAANIRDFSRILIEKHGGQVPEDMDALLELPGVGRKIANLIRGDIFGLPAVVADTHCIRISNRMGLCHTKDPQKVERELQKVIAPEEQSDFCHRLVLFGREWCMARNPRCGECAFPCKQE